MEEVLICVLRWMFTGVDRQRVFCHGAPMACLLMQTAVQFNPPYTGRRC